MHHVAKTFANLFADVLPQADDEARRPHLDDLPVVRYAVEGGMNRQATFPEECLDVERPAGQTQQLESFSLECS